ncbi:hypothetical protein MGA3_01695 [Bacillus methanolicus MGA3]|nr:hypothetical protein MGA3_01695 [Bacillus methanolicus MGA3]
MSNSQKNRDKIFIKDHPKNQKTNTEEFIGEFNEN